MKKILFAFAILLLTSCIRIGDSGRVIKVERDFDYGYIVTLRTYDDNKNFVDIEIKTKTLYSVGDTLKYVKQ